MVQCSKFLVFDPALRLDLLQGVHRVQRVPPTEKRGRRHSSTVIVSYIQDTDSSPFILDPNDVRVDVYRASGAGGQNRNRRDTAIRLTHVPTNIVVIAADQRSQGQNKKIAFERLQFKLNELNDSQTHEALNKQRINTIDGKAYVWTEWRDEVKSSDGKRANYSRALKGNLKKLLR